MAKAPKDTRKSVVTLKHDEASRKNIPTAEYQSVMEEEEQSASRVAYERRNRDLDPQLVWRGKDEQDWSDLVVHAPPLYIQEKVQPKVLIDDLLRRQSAGRGFTGRARRVARQGSMHLYRSSAWDQVQFEFPVVNNKPRCKGRKP